MSYKKANICFIVSYNIVSGAGFYKNDLGSAHLYIAYSSQGLFCKKQHRCLVESDLHRGAAATTRGGATTQHVTDPMYGI